ncbi:unnamed protein product [Urochloa humidicola]
MAGGQWLLPWLLVLTGGLAAAAGGERSAAAPALFVFGDSLIDSGNNNNLASLAKANYFPYGIDFAVGPTGRFCNGYTIVDELVELLGLPLVPPYSQASTVQEILQGANYASAAAGILDDSGANFAGRIPFNQQIGNFEATVAQIAAVAAGGAAAAADTVARSIVFVGMGSNDYLNNYLAPNYDTRRRYDPTQFATLLTGHLAAQLTRLYRAGARKFVVAGVGSMGCIPTVLAQSAAGRFSPEVDALVLPFKANVRAMLDGLNANLAGARFTYLDNFRIFKAILTNPAAFGFSVVDRGCCGIGRNGGQITCLPFMPPCADRERYVFWDAYHPTAAVNVIIAREAFRGGADVMVPINVAQLARL